MLNNKCNHSIVLVLSLLILPLVFTAQATDLTYLSKTPCSETYGNNSAMEEAGYINLNDVKLWVTIKGKSCANPVILFVHGGPGNPMSLYSAALYQQWEQDFTIVHWDQRGSGKTYEANLEAGEITAKILDNSPMTLNLIVKDGLAVADFVAQKLSQEKVILTGTSWGSVVAVNMITEKPELFQFYVGLSQLVNYHANLLNSYQNVLIKLKQHGDQQSVTLLESLGPPPWSSPMNFGKLRRMSRKLEGMSTIEPLELHAGQAYQTAQYAAAYASGEEFSFIKFVGLNADGMAQTIELDHSHLEFKIPVYIIQGEEDLLTSADITKHYFESIKAPFKKYIVVTQSGHDPNKKMLAAQLLALQEGVKKQRQ